ncbi:class F sortase [Cellulomonas sp. PhB150]|uniref:class F sortase n=1 Tax=Cellulomonas sp. PhB150 TaxID=2485188 RepID=UPI000F4705EB|nr:class F sortase [Cellulomonas sp. PhB150]ROS31336.1 sortase family protein [Cellulomonas sp. PhB150]
MATDDARAREKGGRHGSAPAPRAGRRRAVATVLGAALLLGGATAVVIGINDQEPAPPVPPAAEAPVESSTPTATSAPVPAPTEKATEVAKKVPLPTTISIPSLDVSSKLLTLGLAKDGTIAVPAKGKNYDRAAWFDGSPRPGADGPAVIEGHVDGDNGPSVFHDLGKITKGAKITVTREDGSKVHFVVDGVASYPKDDFPVTKVYANTKDPQLRLITCGGEFDRKTGHYVDNTVVFAHQA